MRCLTTGSLLGLSQCTSLSHEVWLFQLVAELQQVDPRDIGKSRWPIEAVETLGLDVRKTLGIQLADFGNLWMLTTWATSGCISVVSTTSPVAWNAGRINTCREVGGFPKRLGWASSGHLANRRNGTDTGQQQEGNYMCDPLDCPGSTIWHRERAIRRWAQTMSQSLDDEIASWSSMGR